MCDPKTMGMLSIGSQIAGGLMGAKGAYDQASTQKSILAVQAAIAQQNEQIANEQASVALENGQVAEQNSRLQTAQVFGAQRAALAANGVDLGEGSPNDILTTTKFLGERDALTIRDNATRQAWGYQVQGVNAANNAQLMQLAGGNINPAMSTAGSLLTTAGSVVSTWYKLNKEGTF